MVSTSQVTVLWFIAVVTLMALLGVDGDDQKARMFKHYTRVRGFPCAQPQPRVVYLEDLMDKEDIPKQQILPASTVLHRCDNAGCCPNKEEKCSPIDSKTVSLVFGVRKGGAKIEFLELSATNHTECGCQDTANKPK